MINISEANYATGSKKVKYVASSVLGMPLEMLGQTIGAILLIDKKNNEDFNTNNEVLLKIVSKMVSLGIHQAGIYEYQEAQLELSREYISM